MGGNHLIPSWYSLIWLLGMLMFVVKTKDSHILISLFVRAVPALRLSLARLLPSWFLDLWYSVLPIEWSSFVVLVNVNIVDLMAFCGKAY